MALKNYKPVTPGSRYKTSLDFSQLTKVDSERSLTKGIPFKADEVELVALASVERVAETSGATE